MTAHDSLFLHSDGVTDAILSSGERLGHERLYTALGHGLETHNAPAAVLHTTRRGLFKGGVRFTDDLTMVLATRSGRGTASRREDVDCSLKSIQIVRRMITDVGLQGGLSEGQASLFTVAAVEAYTNIVRHSTGRLTGAPIEIITSQTGDIIELEMIYLANSFTPPVERTTPDLDGFPEGGFGLGIIRDVCDSIDYCHTAGVNTIRMTKSTREKITKEVELLID